MKQLLILIVFFICIKSNAQTYGNEIQARNNSGTIGKIYRNNDGLKIWDSVVIARLNTIIASGIPITNSSLAVTGTFWQATQPVSLASLPALPAGTNNIGDVDVLTVPSDPFGANADAASATGSISAKLRFIAGTGIPITSLPNVTITTFPDNEPFNVAQINGITPLMGAGNTGTGSLRVTIASDQVAIPVSGTFWQATQPVSIASTIGINTAQVNGNTVNTGNGTSGTGTQRVVIASDQTAFSVNATNIVGTSGGYSADSRTALTNTVVSAKASAGQLYGYFWYNPNATAAYIQVFNTASGSVTLGTTTPVYVITIPATSGANVEFSNGIAHSTAITYAATTTATGNTAPSSSLTGFMLYK
jgi:hypothetical protein